MGEPEELVQSIYDLKQTVYDMAYHVCTRGKAQNPAILAINGLNLRLVTPSDVDEDPKQHLIKLQTHAQQLMARIEHDYGTLNDKLNGSRKKKNDRGTVVIDFPVFKACIFMDQDGMPIRICILGHGEDACEGSPSSISSEFQVFRNIGRHAREMLIKFQRKLSKDKGLACVYKMS